MSQQPVDAPSGLPDIAFPFDAVLFDLDGVVTDTATVHASAWKLLFDAVLHDVRLGGKSVGPPFNVDTDYREYIDGRQREDGVVSFLDSRGIALPHGTPDDSADTWTVHGLATKKDELFLKALGQSRVRVYPGTRALLARLRAAAVPVGLVTASRNAHIVLGSADLDDVFTTIVDGQVAAELRLPGKPDPAMFLEAARRLGVSPHRTAVIEDAIAGVHAARRGGFGLIVGISRSDTRDQLEAAGASIVLDDVTELDLGTSRTDPWTLTYDGFDPDHEGHREALTALGNGYMATRGTRPEHDDDGVHYPGTYLAGIYNRLVSDVHERTLEEEQLINAPNWLPLDVRIGRGQWLSTGRVPTRAERHELDLRRGILTRHATLSGPDGQCLALVQRRLVSMHNPHLATLETTFTALGWSGDITVQTAVNADVTNSNVHAYADRAAKHLASPIFVKLDGNTILCTVRTSQSDIQIAVAARTRVTGADTVTSDIGRAVGGRYVRSFSLALRDGEPATVTKTVAVVTSRDPAISSPGLAALAHLARSGDGPDALLGPHETAWRRLWDQFTIELDADLQSQLLLNLHLFHLLQTISPHTATLDVGVPARGLHGEGYRGHVFWDELFVLPVIGLRIPAVSRTLLDYRWYRLDAARDAARDAGLVGAVFPWQSGSDGREETPEWLYNERSGSWMRDNSRRQKHVGLAVAYNAWQYFQTTGDLRWLTDRGAELIIEVTRMFASLATWDSVTQRFHIEGVMGPDEYHDGYPETPGSGVRDNAYTNVMVSWLCQRAADTMTVLAGHPCEDLITRMSIDPGEESFWLRLSRGLTIPFHTDGIVSQFDGYESLAELDWAHYRATYGNIGRLDLILAAENDTTNRYKIAKQADVLMLFYLLGADTVRDQFHRLGYPVSPADLDRTLDYYLARTAHGSTLSRVVHASVLARGDAARAWDVYREALFADLDDTQWGTTKEGIHLGAMAGTADVAVRSFAGLRTDANALTFDPRVPASLRKIRFHLQYRGQHIDVHLTPHRLRLMLHPCGAAPVRVGVRGTFTTLNAGDQKDFVIEPLGALLTASSNPENHENAPA